MKYLLLTFSIIISSLLCAQEWTLDNDKLTWTKIVHESITPAEAIDLASNFIGDLKLERDNKIIYNIVEERMPYKDYGGNWNTPFFARDPYNATLTIYIKPDKYKIEFSDFRTMNAVFRSTYKNDSGIPFDSHLVKNNKITQRKGLSKWMKKFSAYLESKLIIKEW